MPESGYSPEAANDEHELPVDQRADSRRAGSTDEEGDPPKRASRSPDVLGDGDDHVQVPVSASRAFLIQESDVVRPVRARAAMRLVTSSFA